MTDNFDEDDAITQKALLIDHLIALTVPSSDMKLVAVNLMKIYKLADSGIIEDYRAGKINDDELGEKLIKLIPNPKKGA